MHDIHLHRKKKDHQDGAPPNCGVSSSKSYFMWTRHADCLQLT